MSICVIKHVELAMIGFAFVYYYEIYWEASYEVIVIASGVLIGFAIINIGAIMADLLNNPFDLVVDMYFSAIGAVMFLVVGGKQYAHWNNQEYPSSTRRDHHVWQGSISAMSMVALGIVFIFDFLVAFFILEDLEGHDW